MSEMTRRDFMASAAAMGAMGAGVALVGPVVNVAQAENADVTAEVMVETPATQFDGLAKTSDALMQQVMDEPEVEGDLTLPDGSVVPEVYVRLRNRINRLGKGVGNQPDETSYQMLMAMWTEDDAAHELEMPMFGYFTAYDYSMLSGRPEEECLEILEDMSARCLIYRVRRAGTPYFMLLPHINGFWEFGELKAYYENGIEGVAEFNSHNMWGVGGPGAGDFDGTFPLFRSYPISKDVIAEDDFAPYMDWRAVIKRHQTITVSPCQCRIMFEGMGTPYPEELPQRTCLSLGEMAEYFIENGIGEQISQDEAIEIVEDVIDKGMVPESICTKDVDIICCCHGAACGNLSGLKALAGTNPNAVKNWNAYNLNYDAEKCIGCGTCVARCPMEAISLDDEGKCVHNDVCVRCGQCVAVCPSDARILVARTDFPELPDDYEDCHRYFAKDRMQRGLVEDFTGTSL